jgi:hypothetical protein
MSAFTGKANGQMSVNGPKVDLGCRRRVVVSRTNGPVAALISGTFRGRRFRYGSDSGNIMRSRKEVYQQSSILRHQMNHQEPKNLTEVFGC